LQKVHLDEQDHALIGVKLDPWGVVVYVAAKSQMTLVHGPRLKRQAI